MRESRAPVLLPSGRGGKGTDVKKRTIHYGFFVAIGCFLVMVYGMGMTFNLVSLFLSSMVAERGFSQSQISNAMTLQSVASLLCILFLGKVYAKYSTKKVLAICSLAGVLAYVFFMQDGIVMCYIGAVFVGVAHGGAALVPVSILLTNWFHKYRGTILSCCMVGSSVPNVVWSKFISKILAEQGVTAASMVHGGAILVLCVVSLLLIRDDPKEMGLLPFGETENEAAGPDESAGQKAAVSRDPAEDRRNFVILSVAMFMVGFVITPLNGFYPTFLRSVGYETIFLGTAATVFGITMIVSKVSVGAIIDGFGIRKATFYLYILPCAAVASALMVTQNPVSAIVFVALWGIGNPIGTVPLPLWVLNIFGPDNYKLTYSRVLTIFTLGSTAGFFLIGKIADWTHSYHLVFWINLVFLIVSFFLVMLAQRKKGGA